MNADTSQRIDLFPFSFLIKIIQAYTFMISRMNSACPSPIFVDLITQIIFSEACRLRSIQIKIFKIGLHKLGQRHRKKGVQSYGMEISQKDEVQNKNKTGEEIKLFVLEQIDLMGIPTKLNSFIIGFSGTMNHVGSSGSLTTKLICLLFVY